MMNHLTEYEIIDYLSEELSEQSIKEFDLHLAACSECKDKVEEYNRIINGAKSVFPPEPEEIFWINYLPHLRERMSGVPSHEAGFLHQIAATLTGGLIVLISIIMFAGGFNAERLELNYESWLADKLYETVYIEENSDFTEEFYKEFDLEYYESSSIYQENYQDLFNEISYEQLEAAIKTIADEKII